MKKTLLFTILLLELIINPLNAEEKSCESSRYEVAIELATKLAQLENNAGKFSQKQKSELEQKCIEYSDELAKLGINVSFLEKDLSEAKESVSELKNEVAVLKQQEKNKIELNGQYILENVTYKYDKYKIIDDLHYTTESIILNGKTNLNKNTELFVKWYLAGGDLGSNIDTDVVKEAEMRFNKALGSDGTLRLGRGRYRHGSGFIMNGRYDGVSFSKKNGNTKIEYGMFFEKQLTESYHPICNVYIEKTKNGRKHYLDLFYNSYEDGYYQVSYVELAPKRKVKDCYVCLLNVGTMGTFDKKKEFDYLVDGTVTRLHDDYQNDKVQTGFAGHASIRYTPKKSDFGGLIAYNFYTYDCYEELGVATRANSWESFDSMTFDDKYWDYGHKLLVPNTQSWRFLLSYKPQKHKKHALELNYDYFRGLNSNKPYSHIDSSVAILGINLKEIMYGAEYSYKLTENTTLIVNYEKEKDKTYKGMYDCHNLVFSLVSTF